jgi:hypothetical protein
MIFLISICSYRCEPLYLAPFYFDFLFVFPFLVSVLFFLWVSWKFFRVLFSFTSSVEWISLFSFFSCYFFRHTCMTHTCMTFYNLLVFSCYLVWGQTPHFPFIYLYVFSFIIALKISYIWSWITSDRALTLASIFKRNLDKPREKIKYILLTHIFAYHVPSFFSSLCSKVSSFILIFLENFF